MTREEEITKAAREYVSGVILSSPSDVVHFGNGAKWADEHPKNIWHDATSEEPQGEYEIMVQDEFENVWLTCYQKDIKDYKNGWEECVVCECIVRWAYIDDILPKGGEK